jgi:L-rhamnose mutarotase
MERHGFVWRVRPGRGDEYLQRHATIWPELADRLRDAGLANFTIYLHGELVFGHLEAPDFAAVAEQLRHDPVSIAWEEEMADLLEYPNADEETGWPERLTLVWDLATHNPRGS